MARFKNIIAKVLTGARSTARFAAAALKKRSVRRIARSILAAAISVLITTNVHVVVTADPDHWKGEITVGRSA